MVLTLRLSLIDLRSLIRPFKVISVLSRNKCIIVELCVNRWVRSMTTLSLTVLLSLKFSEVNWISRLAISRIKCWMSAYRSPVPVKSSEVRLVLVLMYLMIAGFIAVGILRPFRQSSFYYEVTACMASILGMIWSLMILLSCSSASRAMISSMAKKLIRLYESLWTFTLT